MAFYANINIANSSALRFGSGFQFITNTAATSRLDFGSNGSANMSIVDGNVGIGTTSPSQKLEVNGIILGTGDIRSPIFYDSNNTAWFIDPSSASNLNTLRINSQLTLSTPGGNGIVGNINAIWGILKPNGYKLYPDEEFSDGVNSITVYNNTVVLY